MESRKTILIFTDWYVPGFKAGGPIQSVYNLVVLLSKHYTVKVICRDRDLNSDSAYPEVQSKKWKELHENHFVMYLSPQDASFSFIKSLLNENKGNIIYINGLYSLKYSVLPTFLASYFHASRIFISVRGMLHASALSVKPLKKQIFLAFARGFGLYRQATMLATDEKEGLEIRRSLGKVNILLAPNIPVFAEKIVIAEKRFKGKGNLSILFLGRIAPEKNPIALLKALQPIQDFCDVTFCGSGLDKEYMDLFMKSLNDLPTNIHAKYIKEIPHQEISNLLNEHHIMALPSLGENFGHAIFESFANGLPVIIGDNTPWAGIETKMAGIEVKPMDIQAITAAIEKFIAMDADEYIKWSNSAKKLSLEYFESNNFEEMYLKIFS